MVQITSGMVAIEGTDAIELTMAFAQKLGAKAYIIQAPVIVRDRANRDAFLKEKQVREASKMARKADGRVHLLRSCVNVLGQQQVDNHFERCSHSIIPKPINPICLGPSSVLQIHNSYNNLKQVY